MVQHVPGPAHDFNRFLIGPTTGFSDRSWVFEDLNSWLTQPDGSPYFLLSGEPGSGKTAIAARLCQFAQGFPPPQGLSGFTPGFLSAYYFCSIQDSGLIHPQTFAESLAKQLSIRYQEFAQALIEMRSDQRIQLSVEQHIETNTGQVTGIQINTLNVSGILPEDVFNNVVRGPLQALFAAVPATQVMILVDALDEALAYQGKSTIVSLLTQTGNLPTGVRFILTCRNGSGIVERFDSKHHLDLSASKHSRDTDDDIRIYVKRRLADEEMKGYVASIGSPAEVEDELVKHASGNFLYAKFFLDEVTTRQRSLSNLVGLPGGLYGLYRHYLDRLVPGDQAAKYASSKWTRRLQPLLGSLSVATPAAPQDALPGWLRLREGIVWPLLGEVSQLTEREPVYQGSYRLYHRSMAEFLITREYQEEGRVQPNGYYTPSKEQHERIVRYYLTNYADDWQDCDLYGLRQLVSHMQAHLSQERNPKKRSKLAEELYTVVLDPEFQRAQREQLGDIHVTLIDLRTTLEIALDRNDLVKALACIGGYRDIIHSQSISQAVFDAAKAGLFELALQSASHYSFTPKPSGGWETILRLYIAWEASEQGNNEAAQRVIASIENLTDFWSSKLAEAFLVRIARTLAQQTPDSRDASAWLTQWNLGRNPEDLIRAYGLAQLSGSTMWHVTELQARLANFEHLIDTGDSLGIDAAPFLDEEVVGMEAAGLRKLLVEFAAQEVGQNGIDLALDLVLPDPYPRYRDIALEALGIACLAVPEPSWVRVRLQSILRAALDREGVTFTFDLPAILLAEAERRNLLAQDLSEYLAQALSSDDRWGTTMRARSARAAAMFWQGQTARAVIEWETAAKLSSGFGGYAVVTLLSLVNRGVEFGFSSSPTVKNLIIEAGWEAEDVLDRRFREERTELVKTYRNWTMENNPDIETVQATLSATLDPETRKAYKDFISARWAGQDNPNLEGLKVLLSMTLTDGTTLDTLMGRLFGPIIRKLSDSDLTDVIRLCATHFMSSRTWELRQWR